MNAIMENLKMFFDSPKIIVLFVLFLLSASMSCGGFTYSRYKDAMIERAKKKLEQADRRFLQLRVTAENSIRAYEDLEKKVEKELQKNEVLKKEIETKKNLLRKSLDKENKEIDKMGINDLVKEFNRLGYGKGDK